MGLFACVVRLLALHSIPVAADIPVEEGNLEEKDTLVLTDILVEEGNLEEKDSLVAMDIPVEEEENLAVVDILVVVGNLVVAHTPVVDNLEVAFATQPFQIVVAHEVQDLSHPFLLVAVQVVVLLLVDRLVVPGCS
jgi:hypothetical protein